jgi:hypothetical protein
MKNININKNTALFTLEQLVEQNINKKLTYMPDSFNTQQVQALELFKQRLFLEKTIDEAISFNKNLVFPVENKNLHLAKTAEDMIDIFKLRSDVYTSINYNEEFPDEIEGLNFDKYDSNSAVLYYKKNNIITGTIRLVFDSNNELPSEDKFSFDEQRQEYNVISELSRLIILHQTKGMSFEFKYLMQGLYYVFNNNDIDLLVLGIKEEHYKLYSKFGGVTILDKLEGYGNINFSALIVSWDLSKPSNFFKKAILR